MTRGPAVTPPGYTLSVSQESITFTFFATFFATFFVYFATFSSRYFHFLRQRKNPQPLKFQRAGSGDPVENRTRVIAVKGRCADQRNSVIATGSGSPLFFCHIFATPAFVICPVPIYTLCEFSEYYNYFVILLFVSL